MFVACAQGCQGPCPEGPQELSLSRCEMIMTVTWKMATIKNDHYFGIELVMFVARRVH